MKNDWFQSSPYVRAKGRPLRSPLEEIDKLRDENNKLREEKRQLEDELFELVVLNDLVPGGPKQKKKNDNGAK